MSAAPTRRSLLLGAAALAVAPVLPPVPALTVVSSPGPLYVIEGSAITESSHFAALWPGIKSWLAKEYAEVLAAPYAPLFDEA